MCDAGLEVCGVGGGTHSAFRRCLTSSLSVAETLAAEASAGGGGGRKGCLEPA